MDETSLIHKAKGEPSRARILQLLTVSETPLGVRELSKSTALHVSTVRSHLEVLSQAGLVVSTAEAPTGPGRPRMLYAASDGPVGPLGGYRLLSEILTTALAAATSDPIGRAQQAGASWGNYLTHMPRPGTMTGEAEVVETVRTMMAEMGFDPEVRESGEMLLHRCPFADLVRTHQDLVCAIHLGMLHGVVDTMNTSVTMRSLDPFVEPTVCRVRLGIAK